MKYIVQPGDTLFFHSPVIRHPNRAALQMQTEFDRERGIVCRRDYDVPLKLSHETVYRYERLYRRERGSGIAAGYIPLSDPI